MQRCVAVLGIVFLDKDNLSLMCVAVLGILFLDKDSLSLMLFESWVHRSLDLFCDLPSHFKRFLNFSDVRSFLSLTVKKGHTSLKRDVQGLNWLTENHAKTLDAVHTANDLKSRVRQTPDSSSRFPILGDEKIKTVQNNSYRWSRDLTTYFNVVVVITKQQLQEKRKCDSKSVFKRVVCENGGCRKELHLARISTPTNLKKPSSFLFLNSSENTTKFIFVYLAQLEFSRKISFCSVLTECVISLRDLMGQWRHHNHIQGIVFIVYQGKKERWRLLLPRSCPFLFFFREYQVRNILKKRKMKL